MVLKSHEGTDLLLDGMTGNFIDLPHIVLMKPLHTSAQSKANEINIVGLLDVLAGSDSDLRLSETLEEVPQDLNMITSVLLLDENVVPVLIIKDIIHASDDAIHSSLKSKSIAVILNLCLIWYCITSIFPGSGVKRSLNSSTSPGYYPPNPLSAEFHSARKALYQHHLPRLRDKQLSFSVGSAHYLQ